MKMDHWLTIAVIISTLIAPILNTLFKFRISQPKPAPEENQPKNLNQSNGGRFKQHLKQFGLIYVSFLVNIAILVWAVYQSAPLTVWSVLIIALATVSIGTNFMGIIAGWAINMVIIYLTDQTFCAIFTAWRPQRHYSKPSNTLPTWITAINS